MFKRIMDLTNYDVGEAVSLGIFSTIILFFESMWYSLFFLLFFIFIDMVSGIALSLHNGGKFEWNKLLITGRKITYFALIVLVGFIFDKVFVKPIWDFNLFFNIFIMLLAGNEFRSILDNFGIILKIDFWNYFKRSIKERDITKLFSDEGDK